MATTYTKQEAIGRAVERARQSAEAVTVWGNKKGDYIFRPEWTAARDFERVGTASYSDGTTVVFRYNA